MRGSMLRRAESFLHGDDAPSPRPPSVAGGAAAAAAVPPRDGNPRVDAFLRSNGFADSGDALAALLGEGGGLLFGAGGQAALRWRRRVARTPS